MSKVKSFDRVGQKSIVWSSLVWFGWSGFFEIKLSCLIQTNKEKSHIYTRGVGYHNTYQTGASLVQAEFPGPGGSVLDGSVRVEAGSK
jgi:hypothetical protein